MARKRSGKGAQKALRTTQSAALYTSAQMEQIAERIQTQEQQRLAVWLEKIWIPYTVATEEMQRVLTKVFAIGALIGKLDTETLRSELDGTHKTLSGVITEWGRCVQTMTGPDQLPPDIAPIIDRLNGVLHALTAFLNGPQRQGDNGEKLRQVTQDQGSIFGKLASIQPQPRAGGRGRDDAKQLIGERVAELYALEEIQTYKDATAALFRRLIRLEADKVITPVERDALQLLDVRDPSSLFRERGILPDRVVNYAAQAARDLNRVASFQEN